MVYAIGKVSVYETSPDDEVVGSKDGVWEKVEYLNPDAVDRHAKTRRKPVMSYGYPIAPETAPKAVIWKSKTKPPPDYALGNNEIMLVSGKFRDLVEQFEPGVHQFLPVAMYFRKNDDAPFETYYWFICCTLIDSLDPAHTTLTWDGAPYDERMDGLRRGAWYFEVTTPPQKAVFSLKAIGDRHLWRDPYRVRDYVHCSDAFADAMTAAGLTGFGLTQYEQI